MQVMRAHILVIACLLPLLAAVSARAQLAVSATAESDYRVRGVSQSSGRPDLRLSLSYDHRSGGYAGLSVVASDSYEGRPGTLAYTGYAGYVTPRHSGLAWEAGITHSHIRQRFTYDYSEIYAGVIGDHFNARLSYSPRYYGRAMQTLYSEVNTGRTVSPHLRVFAHIGALTPLSGWTRRERYDLRAGVAASLRNYDVQLAWLKSNRVVIYPAQTIDDGDALVLSASCYF